MVARRAPASGTLVRMAACRLSPSNLAARNRRPMLATVVVAQGCWASAVSLVEGDWREVDGHFVSEAEAAGAAIAAIHRALELARGETVPSSG
jgi:hypothetical protein